jgi:oxygen-independent coproporphyrinogen-3 oxidase
MKSVPRFVNSSREPADLEADGLVRRVPGGLEVMPSGRLFIRNIAIRFDNQLAPPGERRHSKTI